MTDYPRTSLNMPTLVAFNLSPLMIPNASAQHQTQGSTAPQTVIVDQRILDQLYGFLAGKGCGVDTSKGSYYSSLH